MGREDLIKIFENTVWMCETNHKLKDKIKNSMALKIFAMDMKLQ